MGGRGRVVLQATGGADLGLQSLAQADGRAGSGGESLAEAGGGGCAWSQPLVPLQALWQQARRARHLCSVAGAGGRVEGQQARRLLCSLSGATLPHLWLDSLHTRSLPACLPPTCTARPPKARPPKARPLTELSILPR